MKCTVLFAIAMLFGSYLYGQTNATAPNGKAKLVTGTYATRTGQMTQVQSFVLRGADINSTNGLLSCRGDCEVTLGGALLKADEVDFHSDTGEAEARGNVRIKALPLGAPGTHQP